LKPNEKKELKVGDKIRFGRFSNIYEVSYWKFNVVLSSLNTEEGESLQPILTKIGAKVQDEFDENCTHLTTSKTATLSHKLISALAWNKPIVTPDFWEKVFYCVQNNIKQLPSCKDFIPAINDRTLTCPRLISLDLDPKRQELFRGKTFMFMSKSQENEYAKILKGVGGKSNNLVDNKKIKLEKLIEPAAIVVQPSGEAIKNTPMYLKIASKFLLIYILSLKSY
jgi:BRCA1 C Terminus (BRCT) domain/Second BRCT domain on Nijmegen syndrome breakage protein